jgi:hypothetical protein
MIIDQQRQGNSTPRTDHHSVGKGVIILSVLSVIMGFTNPPKPEYLSYASHLLSTELKKSVCNQSQVPDFLQEFSQTLVGVCNSLVTTQRHTLERLIDNTTERRNLILFSIYTTEVGGSRYHTIGAFGNFLTFPPSEKSQGR